MSDALFTVFGLFTIAAAAVVVFARSPVHSAAALILSFFGLSSVYLLWGATFIAMIQILIYTGAIVVLFVFVVMLLDLGRATGAHSNSWFMVMTASAAVWFFALLMLRTLNQGSVAVLTGSAAAPAANDMRLLSKMLFNEYLWPFEVLSIFLLALIVAIFAVARPEARKKSTSAGRNESPRRTGGPVYE